MPLTFGVTDPYWQQRQLDRTTETLSFLRSLVEQKRAKKERRLQQDLKNFLQVADRSPGAAVKMGRDIQEKYGDRAPDLSPFLNTLSEAGERAKQIKGAGKKWLSQADKLRQQYGDEAEQLLSQAMNPGMPVEARTKAAQRLQQIGQMNPDVLYGEAARELAPTDRTGAEVWAKSQGVAFPTPQQPDQFDPGDLPSDIRALYESDKLPPEAQQAARINAGLEPSVSAARSAELTENAQRIREMEMQKRQRGQQGRAQGGESPEPEKRRSDVSTFKNLAKSAADEVSTKLEQLPEDTVDRETKESLKSQGITVKDSDKRFKPLKGHLDSIGSEANRAYLSGDLSLQEAQAAAYRAAQEYTNLVLSGMLPQKAFKKVRGDG